ncbi:phenolphthiocerol/phthiocerol polyketide synthase subunit C-like isoform X1 [Entelurus aequoreus]|uniref:phenolphthiocerol/phthiocerol polyketide synthase subunit C-like isoform X1 n=1 Tax=Entelurus aequoreus TaxID=161455 RepID=UPI002B1E17D9|nr:phenolphthiocerol/phthiocerol polyketide synthase subunit C-like isoform X1 [Entelurus aequoreus]XP_061877007.1 phenolphthiocerol/phthiocerol polyketide synthase subunit C-like isoform X1 [Entelurus aequoreus]
MDEAEDSIAVVGIGCNFPGGEGLDNFWKVLVNGRNCSVLIPKERFELSSWYDPDDNKAGKSRTAKAALLDGFNQFDHKFFGISDSEVEQMDPQQKQLLQCVYRALENAGIPMEKASGTRTGVFFGLMNRDYETNAAHVHPRVINHWTGTGLAMSIAANRVSYIFNFTGPSLSIDCACSSSLVALHLACQAIKQGDCDMAVCGGVNCIFEPRVFVALSKAKMISPDGTSKPFSNKADGYGRGEGCGVVLLKPLTKALQDQDHIWGIISKTAVNQDGHSVSPITKPSLSQQEELLRRTYSERDITNVHYIEAHGTGTPVGDPTEAASISNVIAKAKAPGSAILRIGSVKSNIGHTESAAGVAGVIKVLLMMKHETIVPSVFFCEDTAGIDSRALNLHVPKEVEKWEATGARVAGVNNFGFGGTNAHAIVRQHMWSHSIKKNDGRQVKYFVMSANSPKSLMLTLENAITHLENNVDLDCLLYTAACRRSHFKHKYRRALMVSSLVDLREKLHAAVSRNTSPSLSDPKLVFVFCGNGVTYHGMGKQLLRHEPVFRDTIKQISEAYQRLSVLNILDTLESEHEHGDYNAPHVVQPLLFAIQVGVATLLKCWGVKADAMLGHSVGEVSAAHCSGLLSLEDALKVIYFRSVLQTKATGGKMLVVSNMAVSEVTALLSRYSGRICLAAFNSPQSCTLSGDADAIENLQEELSSSANSQNLFIRVLEVSAAYHSHMMNPILPKIREAIGSLEENELSTQLFSTVTGKEAQQGDFCSGDYWARNIREPVAFEQAVRSASGGQKSLVFLEVGPRRALQRNIMETLGNDVAVVASLQPDKDHETLLSVVSKLFELGVQVDWNTFYAGYETVPLPFPKYQFDCSDRDVIIKGAQKNTMSTHPLLCATGSEKNTLLCDVVSDSVFYLKEHKHNKVPIIPGSFYAELGLAAFMACAKPKVPLNTLQLSVNFHSPFILTPNSPEMKVQLKQKENNTSFTVFSSSATCASGTVVVKKERPVEEQRIDLNSIYKRCTSVVTYQEFYGYLSQGGFQYGDVFQNKANVHYGEDLKEAYAVVTVQQELLPQLHDYCVHPVVLDFLMQLLPVTVEHIFADRPGFPAKIGSLTVSEPLQDEMIVYLRATDVGADHFEVCGCFADRDGNVLVEVRDVLIKYLGSRSHVVEEYFYHNHYSVISEGITNDPPLKALVFSDSMGISKCLQQNLDSRSRYISFSNAEDLLSSDFPTLLSNLNITNIEDNFDEVLFLWGKENLNSLTPDVILENLTNCCEMFRQVILELKRIRFPNSIRAITYCSSELTVDHVNPGFAIVGMTRSFAAEIPELSFQLVDISSVSAKDIAALSEVLRAYPCSKYPELVVKDGVILKPSIKRTPPELTENSEGSFTSSMSEPCVLQTVDAFKISRLTAVHFDTEAEQISDTSVEIQPTKVCVHSSDYFPVSTSHLNFGQTLYWNTHSLQNHKLLMLDFSGIITGVGKEVKKLKVGDSVASCYPVVAASRVRIPQEVCYSTKRLPFLQSTPCLSYFVLAWEILYRLLPRAKQNLGIVSLVPDSVLVKVLALVSQKLGWTVIVGTQCNGSFIDASEMGALIVLPPYDESLMIKVCNFPGVQNVVLVREYQTQLLVTQDVLQSFQESVHVQTINLPVILQKGSLSARRLRVYHLLKSLNLTKKFSLASFTFQNVTSEKIHNLYSQSYFRAKNLAVVALEKGSPSSTSDIPLRPTKKQIFRRKAVYIVAGGLTGLGFETVKFISQRGGEFVVILSRSKPSAEVQQEICNVEKQCGNSIVSMECDISVSGQVLKVVSDIHLKFKGYPIRGVFHSAVVLHDGLIEALDRSLYEIVFKPKVNGVLNLHHATLSCQLDYFVCYSSISAFLGNASQTNYAAANTFLDLFCQYRRKLGLSGQSINWGALNLGLLLNKEFFHRFLEAKGMMVLKVAEIHKSLEQCLLLNRPQQAVCRFHFRNIRFNVLSQNAALTMRLSALVEQAFQKSREFDTENRNTVEVPARDYLNSLIVKTIGLEVDTVKDDTPFSSLGIDSMQAMTLQNLIYQDRGINVPLVKLLDPNATLSTVMVILSEGNGDGTEDQLSTDESTFSTKF